MIVVNDFFKRHKEAVSNQMELVKNAYDCRIITATRFMNQKAFQKEDRNDKIYIYNPFFYHIVLFFNMFRKDKDIHIFEEEPQFEKRFLFNTFNKNVYVSMYREPFLKYAEHLKKYKNLKAVYVEMEEHKQKLIDYGINKDIIHVTYTPAKIKRKVNRKKYNPQHVNLLFASWNNKEGNPLSERGLIYLLDLLQLNEHLYLTILLRDNDVTEYLKMIHDRKLENRIELLDINEKELSKKFDNSDFVVFPIQKRITKDVPNSLIDGISRGKPVLLSTIFGLSKTIKDNNAGIIIEPNTKPFKFNISEKKYYELSTNAYNLSKRYVAFNYKKEIIDNFREVGLK